MSEQTLEQLRSQIDEVNVDLLRLMNRRLRLIEEVKSIKQKTGIELFDPKRESDMFTRLLLANEGPMTADHVRHIFKEVFKMALGHMEADTRRKLMVHRRPGESDRVYEIRGHRLGHRPLLVSGPCSVESFEQTEAVARHLKSLGVRFLRGGAFKPRTSPYTFQGLGVPGLKILREVADLHDMAVVTEILDPRDFESFEKYADVFQVGTRNMYNYELLKLVGRANKPVLLKRGFMATLEEFILAAEYIANQGNDRIILCERGIRTHEPWTRNTLDLSAIPLLKIETPFPIVVDVGHGTGRKDIMVPMAKAAIAAGASAIMVETHPNPALALSDNAQQLTPDEATRFVRDVFGSLEEEAGERPVAAAGSAGNGVGVAAG